MQRIVETLLERRGLAVWVEDRVLRLLKDGATVHMARGYTDYACGQEPDYFSVVGEPFAAEHYYEGYELAAYELGDLRMSTQEENVDLAA
jgi:hypothetical protein